MLEIVLWCFGWDDGFCLVCGRDRYGDIVVLWYFGKNIWVDIWWIIRYDRIDMWNMFFNFVVSNVWNMLLWMCDRFVMRVCFWINKLIEGLIRKSFRD